MSGSTASSSDTPATADHLIRLRDGRKLAYTDVGAKDGYPVFFGHGMPGSRLEGRFFHQRARRHGFRIITPDRPGIGLSDFQERRSLLDYPSDILQLANTLGFERFSHVGWSSGGSRTLACAFALGRRMDLGVCLSGYTSFDEYQRPHQFVEGTRWPGPRLARMSPRLTRIAVRVAAWMFRRHPGLYMREAEQLISQEDRDLLRYFLRGKVFRRDQMVCLASGGDAIATDLLTELESWGFTLSEVNIPILLYQGMQDPFIPVDYARHLANNLPQASLTLLPEAGHLYPLAEHFQDDLFSRIRQYLNHNTET
ncbi:alpha/beta hydrolase [Marinobacter salinisoli]|uniref:Alpha/beta hydrolase n=1 Tax=Marinobacter salinisoli TaxID=2769486 RepID=A0ABX7MQY7_9GAMM|nr:alpha/beta hydrolase [Marinobacter salinisoli]QSP94720.1 alpha/beta hydrolase [Marinobacter salinisoli]